MGFPLCSPRCDDWSRGTGGPGSVHSTPLSQWEVLSVNPFTATGRDCRPMLNFHRGRDKRGETKLSESERIFRNSN